MGSQHLHDIVSVAQLIYDGLRVSIDRKILASGRVKSSLRPD